MLQKQEKRATRTTGVLSMGLSSKTKEWVRSRALKKREKVEGEEGEGGGGRGTRKAGAGGQDWPDQGTWQHLTGRGSLEMGSLGENSMSMEVHGLQWAQKKGTGKIKGAMMVAKRMGKWG
jgi:hypothetical protein